MTCYFPQTLRTPSLLLCTTLLAACGSKLTEPVKAIAPLYTAPTALVNVPPPYASAEYGVPETARVEFNANASTTTQDLTY
jgi:hypothetical protein